MKPKLRLLGLVFVLSAVLLLTSGCNIRSVSDATSQMAEETAVTATPTAPPLATPAAAYTPEQFREYFYEIALGTEFYAQTENIRKWSEPMTLEVAGSPTATDTATLNQVISEIRQITGGRMTINLVPSNGNAKITFAPLDELKKYEPHIMPDNWGFFYVNWDGNFQITKANIVIATDKPTQLERNHLIREELTQSLGLMQDSDKYSDSIFYIEWTDTQNYSELDKALIAQLYDPAVRAGMTRAELAEIIK